MGAAARVIVEGVLRLLAEIAAEPGESLHVSHFDCVVVPEEPLLTYGVRIFEYMKCSCECFVLALIYIHRYLEAMEERISATNAHRLLVTSVRLATKIFDDEHRSNKTCAALGGLRTRELNELESLLLEVIEWRVYVSQEECEECMGELRSRAPAPLSALSDSCESPVHRRATAAIVVVSRASSPATPPKEAMRRRRQRQLRCSSGTAAVVKIGFATANSRTAHKVPRVKTISLVLNKHLKSAGRRVTSIFV